jgi:hypothetical protein
MQCTLDYLLYRIIRITYPRQDLRAAVDSDAEMDEILRESLNKCKPIGDPLCSSMLIEGRQQPIIGPTIAETLLTAWLPETA